MARKVREQLALPSPQQTGFGFVVWGSTLVRQIAIIVREFGYRLNLAVTRDGQEPMRAPLPLAEYTTATLPPADEWEGSVIYVSDGSSGEKFRGSDGTSWLNLG